MGFFSSASKPSRHLLWNVLTAEDQLLDALEQSDESPVLFFKHSTRCSISSMALSRFEENWDPEAKCTIYFLDLIQFRSLSNKIADLTGVEHQSPQVIVLSKKKVIYTDTHSAIDSKEILERIK